MEGDAQQQGLRPDGCHEGISDVIPVNPTGLFADIQQTARLLRRRYDRLCDSQVLTPTQWHIIRYLAVVDCAAQSDIGQALGLSPVAVSSAADRLASESLLVRVPHPHDRRKNLLQRTKLGLKLAQESYSAQAETIDTALKGISQSELQIAAGVMQSILANVRD